MATFLDSVKYQKPTIYHILDGFLGEGIDGYNSKSVNIYLRANYLDRFSEGEDKKVFLLDDYDKNQVIDTIKSNRLSVFNLNMKTLKGGHALALLIYYDNSSYHIFLVNSGFGIDKFKSNKNNKDKMIPFDYFVTNDETKVITLLEVILILNSGTGKYVGTELIRTEEIYNIIRPYVKYKIEWIEIKKNKLVLLNLSDKPYYYIEIVQNILGETDTFTKKPNPEVIEWSESDTVLESDISSIASHSYNDFVKKKLIFHDDFKVIPQQQGTCTWFCKYWVEY